jgi:LytS/YehU family sensor histidine kinase
MQQHAEAAEQYLRDLAALMRHIVEALDKPLVPLATELEIARLYLELERRNGKLQLEYAIELEPSLDAHESCVPPLLLQPIVENALKHGLAPKGGGRLRIAAWAEGEQLLIAIEDDGVGRSSEGVSRRQHRSMGLQLTTERLRLLQQSVGRRAEFEIQDLHREDGCPAGTRVLFRLPAELTLQDMELGPPPP